MIVAPNIVKAPIQNGVVLVAADGHYWPGRPSTAHRAFVKFCRTMKPKVVIFNGDALDAATISRHPPIGWEGNPSLQEELACVRLRLGEIRRASPGARHIWPLGNHDARFNTRLATVAPEFKGVAGTRLVDHFPDWEPCWTAQVGGAAGIVVKHRWKGGRNAAFSNARDGGRSIATGHLHSLAVAPYTDYNGTRWGIDCGCIADPYGPQFAYCEDNSRDWRSGFVMLTWKNGQLMWPELIAVHNEKKGIVQFRGEFINA